MKKCLAIMLSLICIPNIVNAASSCTYAEQNELYQKAANIKPKVEIVQETLHFNDGDVDADIFQISVLNITEDFYVVITNDYNSETKTLTYSDVTDGVATYTWRNIDAVTNFTYKVYSSNKTSCPDEVYQTGYFTTPRYNEFSAREICQELTDFYLCQKYVTFAEMDVDKFYTQIDSYQNGEVDDNGEINIKTEPTVTDNIFNFIDKYKVVIILVIVILAGGGIYIYKKNMKRQKELGL